MSKKAKSEVTDNSADTVMGGAGTSRCGDCGAYADR